MAIAAASLACSQPSLETKIGALVGPNAIDCGHVRVEGDRSRSAECLVNAFRAGRPFSVRYDRHGIDSHLETALVRSRDGRLLKLEYDSDVRGGSSLRAKPSLSERPCVGRLSETAGQPPAFTCE